MSRSHLLALGVRLLGVALAGLSTSMAAGTTQSVGAKIPKIIIEYAPPSYGVRQEAEQVVRWRTRNAPPDATVTLWIEKVATRHLIGPIASNLPLSGRYVWQVPGSSTQPTPCARDMTGGCMNGMNTGTRYAIVLHLYAPAAIGDHVQHNQNQLTQLLASVESAPFDLVSAR